MALTNLKRVDPECKISSSVAVVGSSGILLERDFGELIDSFDEIVRFNRAPVKEYERWVGSRTTIRLVNPHVLACMDIGKAFSNQKADFVKDCRNCKIISLGPENEKLALNKHKKNIHESCDLFKVKPVHAANCTKGSTTIGLAFINLLIMSNITPHVFGFYGLPGKKGKEGLSHYWETRPNKSTHHNYGEERKVLKEFIKREKVVYYE